MIYVYNCEKCDTSFEVVKSVKDIDVNEFCPTCDNPGIREFIPRSFNFAGTAVQHAEYNVGLGCVVKDKYHRSELCKEKNVIEVGNDYKSGASMFDTNEKERLAKRANRWKDFLK